MYIILYFSLLFIDNFLILDHRIVEKKVQNNHLKGIVFMLLASLFFAVNDALVKVAVKNLGSDYSLFNVVFIRAIFREASIFSKKETSLSNPSSLHNLVRLFFSFPSPAIMY